VISAMVVCLLSLLLLFLSINFASLTKLDLVYSKHGIKATAVIYCRVRT